MPIIEPTSLTPTQIQDFKEIYQKQFKEEISLVEAERKGLLLVQFMAFIFQLSGADFPDEKK